MSKAKFTPGPWRATKAGASVFDSEGRTVAWPAKGSPHSADSNAERAANARLIAAAPDLLAALISLTNTAIEATSEDGDISAIDGSLIDQAHAAIAKAKGEPDAKTL